MGYPLEDSSKMEDAKNYITNILKMEGYKLNSGELFVAFKEAGGEMSDFKGALEELTSEGKIKSDADGNIMTVEDYQREKSQTNDKEETEEIIDDNEDDLESIIKLKEETDSWLIEKLKNNGTDDSLRDEVKELKERVAKLEKIISNLTRAFD
jgi:predicted  nucleic acid-binding Zn-ribbon protein